MVHWVVMGWIAAQTAAGGGAEVRALEREALAGHPTLRAADEQIDALGHAVPASWVWPDTVVGTEYSNMPILTPWPGNHPMSGVQLKVTQKVPFPTKFWARADAAEAARDAAVPLRAEAAGQIVGRVRGLVLQWQRLSVLAGVTAQHRAAVAQMLDVVRVKYELGRVEQHELIRLEVLRDRLDDDHRELIDKRRAVEALLNAAAQRPAGTPLDVPADIAVPDQAELDVATLLEEARAHRPLLAAMRESATAERAQAGAMRAEMWPDVTAWAGYRVRLPSGADPGNNFVSAGIAVPIPWSSALWQWEERAQAHDAKARAEDARRAGAELSLRGEIEAATVRYRRARERARVYDEQLLPGAQKTLEAAFASYQVDRAGFADLFAAELTVLDFERVACEARAEAAAAAIALDVLTGRTVPTPDEGAAR